LSISLNRVIKLAMSVAARIVIIMQFPLVVIAALIVGAKRTLVPSPNRRIFFGGCGIINNKSWSEAARIAGFESRTIVWSTPSIYPEDTFDVDLFKRFGSFAGVFAPSMFVFSIMRCRLVVCGFDGYILGITPLRFFENWLIHLAKCKVIAAPYGGDAYSYSSVRNENLQHALQISYPEMARKQHLVLKRVRKMAQQADFVIPGLMGFDGIGRWDVLTPSALVIDTNQWKPLANKHDGTEMRVAHAPNHRGFKGTEFLIKAVDELRAEGHNITLRLFESVPNTTIRDQLSKDIDVLVEQLIHTGYAMNGVEGLACGVVVVANLEDDRILTPFRRWSFLSECPIVSASPENVKGKLLELYNNPELRKKISLDSREYAMKRHSIESFSRLITDIEKHLFGGRESLINYYHPLMENRGDLNCSETKRITANNE
jgi:hypothetical protein